MCKTCESKVLGPHVLRFIPQPACLLTNQTTKRKKTSQMKLYSHFRNVNEFSSSLKHTHKYIYIYIYICAILSSDVAGGQHNVPNHSVEFHLKGNELQRVLPSTWKLDRSMDFSPKVATPQSMHHVPEEVLDRLVHGCVGGDFHLTN